MLDYRDDSIWNARGVAAFFLAPLAPAVILSLTTDLDPAGSFLLVAGIAFAHVVVFGVPLAIVMDRRRTISLPSVILASFLIGFLPWMLFTLYSLLPHVGATIEKPGNILIDGLDMSFWFGCLGLAAGVLWWLVATPWRAARGPEVQAQ